MQNVVKFEDLIFLFNPVCRGQIRLDLDEAVYLYKLVKSLKRPYCIEIGRLFGGSTILMAGAGGKVLSLDIHISKSVKNKGEYYDTKIRKQLKRLKLLDNVEIIVADSTTYKCKKKVDILFIDGDHTYEGVKKDYNNWISNVKSGGHILFHDACYTRPGATRRKSVAKFVEEIKLKKICEIGSLVHFQKD